MPTNRRVYMVADKIREIVAAQLHRVSDPRLTMVTVTNVVPSPDLRQAKVYWVTSGDQERLAEVDEALSSAEGLFKRALSKGLGLRFVPQLRFYYDDTMDTVDSVHALLKKIKPDSGSSEEEGE